MICPNCNTSIPDRGKFCPKCGTVVSTPAADASTSSKLKIRMGGASSVSSPSHGSAPEAPSFSTTAAPEEKAPSYSAPPPAPPVPPVSSAPSSAAPVYPSAPAPAYAMPALPSETSVFDGSFIGYLGVNLAVSFLSTLTLGLAFPWLWCYKRRWVYSHTCINGYRLHFDGKGIQIFGKWLLWILLTIVTLTIFALWIPIRLKKWEIKHVTIDSVVINPR